MRRAGGYRTFHTAFNRLLLEDSRPLESASANRFRPGLHDVEVLEFEWGWDFVKLRFEGRARRRIAAKMSVSDLADALGIEVWPGELGGLRRQFLGRQFRVRIEDRGDVELRVCADGSILALREGRKPKLFDCLSDADDWLREKGLTKVRPRVVDFL